MNRNPQMNFKQADKNISKIFNPKEEKYNKIKKEVSDILEELI